MKAVLATRLGQSINLTPQLLQSIRLLQLDGLQLEMEVTRALEHNPLLEREPDDEGSDEAPPADIAAVEAAAWDELPEPAAWTSTAAGAGHGGEDDPLQRLPAGESSDPRVRVLQRLAFELDAAELRIASWLLDHVDDAGYLEQSPETLATQCADALHTTARRVEAVRQRILHGEPTGYAARDLAECLLAQLAISDAPARALATRILHAHVELLAAHDYAALADHLDVDPAQVADAVALILSLQPRPAEMPVASGDYVLPDVLVWRADGDWRVALNPATTPKLRVNAYYEQTLTNHADQPADTSAGAVKLREMLQEARWLTRGLSMRYDTLLRTTLAIVERQRAFLERGDEAMAPLTLKEIADAIGMHESTVSRITSGKYLQTPRGTFELKRFFAVRLEGASVSGAAVRAMVKRLIDNEPAATPLADDTIAGLLARQGIHIARRTVAKYRDQLRIPAARARQRPSSGHAAIARTGTR